ncbi:hypothetical protein ABID53_000865 [Bacillus oleivorans]|uniref:hypothetical protein n=1 Tax=Bacillus oleivorans TaxID=1448271 RepID=UPI000BE3FBCC|nr:hypothetical protein [Bacillus oleivorans]
MIISIIVVSEIIYLKTPKVGVWNPPDTEDIMREVVWGVLMVIIFTLQEVNGLYQYNKQKSKRDTNV